MLDGKIEDFVISIHVLKGDVLGRRNGRGGGGAGGQTNAVIAETDLPNGSLLWPGEIVNGPGVAAGENGIQPDTGNVDGKVAHCYVIFDGFGFGEENGVCDDEEGLGACDKWHTPSVSISKERGD